MLENHPYFLELEVKRLTKESLDVANRIRLAKTAKNQGPSARANNPQSLGGERIGWAKICQKTLQWFKPVNA